MQCRTLYIPERSDALALKIAYAVQSGVVPCLAQYLDEGRAEVSAATLARLHGDASYRVRCVTVEMKTHDDGRIPVARIVDRLGEIAATMIIVIGGAYAAGIGSII